MLAADFIAMDCDTGAWRTLLAEVGGQAAAAVAEQRLAARDPHSPVNGTPGMDALRNVGADAPIVFVVISYPAGAGYVSNLSRPGGNATGFSTLEPEMAGKGLQLLRQVAPRLKHVTTLPDPKSTGFNALWQAAAEIAPRHGMVLFPQARKGNGLRPSRCAPHWGSASACSG